MMTQSRRDLRAHLRAARRSVSGRRRRRWEALIARRIARLPAYRTASFIAVYLSFDGEVDLSHLLQEAAAAGKTILLPVIQRRSGSRMCFRRYRPGDHVRRNRFGIREPCLSGRIQIRPSRIGLVLMPVVGFDVSGTRLGMGGGFYDRYFARLRERPGLHNRLVGIAFECQKVDALPRCSWDVPMAMVVTEKHVYRSLESSPHECPAREESK